MDIGQFSFSGLASGIDTKALVDAIIAAERRPIQRLETRQSLLEQKKSAFDEMRSQVNDFLATLRDLSSTRVFRGRTATVADEKFFTASAGIGAELGLFAVEVQQLAAANKIGSNGVAEKDQSLVSAGTITIQSGDNDPITIDVSAASGNNTLEAVRDAINGTDAGVSASILFDGTEYRLIVRAEESGVDNALGITDTTNLGLDDPLNEVVAAQDATLTVDGIQVTSASNQVSGVISGVTLDLLSVTEGSPVSLQVGNDVDSAVEAVQSLVEAYNETIGFFNQQFDLNNPGPLSADSLSRRIRLSLQSLVTAGLDGVPFGGVRSLSTIGVSFDGRSGEMTLDTAKLRELLEERFDEVGDLFLTSGTASDPRIKFLGAGADAAGGEYAVEITQAGEQATLLGSAAVKPGGIKNDETLTITVGTDSVNVDLFKNMTITDIVDAVNTALDGAGLAATASDEAGALRISTNALGSDQSLTVASSRNDPGNGNQAGFDDTPSTDTGQDVAGRIGGVDATGVGQVLTAPEGGDTDGISILVTATAADIAATGGDFGTVGFSPGLTQRLTDQLAGVTQIGDGRIDAVQEIIDRQLDRISDDILRLEERLVGREARLIRTFARAEQAIALLQAQQNGLAGFSLLGAE